MPDIVDLHKSEYDQKPDIIAQAPGVVNIMGEHTEENDGFVLQFAINRHVTVALSKRDDSALRFHSVNLNERKRSNITNLKYKREDRWANLMKGVLYSLIQDGCPVGGLNISISSTIPMNIGLASSAALEIAFAKAAVALFDYKIDDNRLIDMARSSETVFLEKESGIASYITACHGTKGKALFIDTRNGSRTNIPLNNSGILFVITDSKIPQNIIAEEYNSRKLDCQNCIQILSGRKRGRNLRDFSIEDVQDSMGEMPEEIRRRCLHVISEIEQTQQAYYCLLKNDYDGLGKIIGKSHESLRDFYEVSCPEIDWLVKRANETNGIYGSRLTGAGFGGCTLTILDQSALEKYKEHIEEYERIFGFSAELIFCEASDGVRLL